MPAVVQRDPEALQSQIPSRGGSGGSKLKRPPRPLFLLLFSPSEADVYLTREGPELLPILHELGFNSGVEGLTMDSDGQPSLTLTLARHAERGWVQVPIDAVKITAFGEPLSDYVRLYQGVSGPVHMLAWKRIRQVGGLTVNDFDHDGWHDYLRAVRDHFLPDGWDPAVRDAVETRMRRVHDDLASYPEIRRTARQSSNLDLLAKKLRAFDRRPRKGGPAKEAD